MDTLVRDEDISRWDNITILEKAIFLVGGLQIFENWHISFARKSWKSTLS